MAILKQLDDTPMKFGMHRGKTPNEIAKRYPNYIIWIYENIEQKHCTEKLYKECLAQRQSQMMAYMHTDYDGDDIGDDTWSGRGWGLD